MTTSLGDVLNTDGMMILGCVTVGLGWYNGGYMWYTKEDILDQEHTERVCVLKETCRYPVVIPEDKRRVELWLWAPASPSVSRSVLKAVNISDMF